jgi:hypothetical protein
MASDFIPAFGADCAPAIVPCKANAPLNTVLARMFVVFFIVLKFYFISLVNIFDPPYARNAFRYLMIYSLLQSSIFLIAH